MKRWWWAGCLFMATMQAFAGQAVTASLNAMAQVQGNCNVVGGNVTLAFGNYDPVGVNASSSLDSATTFSLRCTRGVSATIDMNNGLNANGGFRRMNNQLNGYMNYQLYTDAARAAIWGDGHVVQYAANSNAPTAFTVYGRVPAGQGDVTAGAYSDTVVITVTF